MKSHIADSSLAPAGKKKIEWAAREMPVLTHLEERFKKQQPFKGIRLAACLHVTTETARLAQVLKAGGASVAVCASNPLSTKDEVAASLVKHDNIEVHAVHDASRTEYYKHLKAALDTKPHITLDDGADLLTLLHGDYKKQLGSMLGSTEETTTGVIRLRALEASGNLALPVIAVNDALTKHLFDNRYGTGQSTLDGIIRATNVLIAGKQVVVAGYGWCGKGVAMRAHGMGAHVAVLEIDPVRALEAVMDGFEVTTMARIAPRADIIVTVTGNRDVVDSRVFSRLKNGCILANSGHFDVEIDVAALRKRAKSRTEVRPGVFAYTLSKKQTVYVLSEGRLVNLAAAEGHPSAVMDMSFAGQALAVHHLVTHGEHMEAGVYRLPEKLDKEIAQYKLSAMGMSHDRLTPKQKKYLASWNEGT